MLAFAAMRIFRARFVQSFSVALALLIVVSSLAWSTHLDAPDLHDTAPSAHMAAAQSFDQTPPSVAQDSADHADHCCHGSAHLVGLGGVLTGAVEPLLAAPPVADAAYYDSVSRAPLIDPPIA